jgi:hypothetical protein
VCFCSCGNGVAHRTLLPASLCLVGLRPSPIWLVGATRPTSRGSQLCDGQACNNFSVVNVLPLLCCVCIALSQPLAYTAATGKHVVASFFYDLLPALFPRFRLPGVLFCSCSNGWARQTPLWQASAPFHVAHCCNPGTEQGLAVVVWAVCGACVECNACCVAVPRIQ